MGIKRLESPCLRLATFNVEKLSDGKQNPTVGKPYREIRKSDESVCAVADILAGSHSHIISLQEIENLEMFERLRDQSNLRELYPYTVFLEGNDRRKGFDVALMSRYPIQSFATHREHKVGELEGEEQYFSRDLLQVDVKLPKDKLMRVFCTHFVAYSNSWCEAKRTLEAEATSEIVRSETQRYPADYTVVLGDFNDTDSSTTLKTIEEQTGLQNSSQGLPASWGATKPHGTLEPALLDHILVDSILAKSLRNRGVLVHPDDALASDHRLVWAEFELAS